MPPHDIQIDIWSDASPPPIVRMLRPEDLAPPEPLIDAMAFSAAIFAAVGAVLILTAFARRRRSELDLAFRTLSRALKLSRRETLALRQIAPLAGDAHPVALLLSPHALTTALARVKDAAASGAMRVEASAMDGLSRLEQSPSVA